MPIDSSGTVARSQVGFDVERLRKAGASLGPIQSTIVPPRTTFEELIERASDLQRRAAALERKAS